MKNPILSRRSRRSSRHGFTLMEMLIVLSIIALLMGIAMYNLTGIRETAKQEKAETDIASFKEALIAYELESGTMPTTEQGLKALWIKPTVEPVPQRWRAMLEQETLDPWGHAYQFRNPGKHNPTRYDIFSMGPDGQPDTDDDIGNWKAPSSNP